MMTDDKKELPKAIKETLTLSEGEIAEGLKTAFAEAMGPALAIMDHGASMGFALQWDAVIQTPPDGKHRVVNLRAVKVRVY